MTYTFGTFLRYIARLLLTEAVHLSHSETERSRSCEAPSIRFSPRSTIRTAWSQAFLVPRTVSKCVSPKYNIL